MPRYFFHLRDDLDAEDNDGQELPDLPAAYAHAVKYAADMAAVSITEQRKINLRHRIEVTDERGEMLIAVAFGDVVTVEG